MEPTLAQLLHNPADVRQQAIDQALTQCPLCADELRSAYERLGAHETLYAYACDVHAPFLRTLFDPSYIGLIRADIARCEQTIELLNIAITNLQRIERGKDILCDPTLTETQRTTYEGAIATLREQIATKYRDSDVTILSSLLDETTRAMRYFDRTLLCAMAFQSV